MANFMAAKIELFLPEINHELRFLLTQWHPAAYFSDHWRRQLIPRTATWTTRAGSTETSSTTKRRCGAPAGNDS